MGPIRNMVNAEVASELSWIVMHVLHERPPSVPPRGEKRVSFPTWEQRFKEERVLVRDTRRRYEAEWSEEGGESEKCYE